MATIDHSLDAPFYEGGMYAYPAGYRSQPQHAYAGHQSHSNSAGTHLNLGASSSSSSQTQHNRRDSTGMRLDPPQLPNTNTHNPRNHSQSAQNTYHGSNSQDISALTGRARSSSAATLEHQPRSQPTSAAVERLDFVLEQARNRPPQYDERQAAQVALEEEPLYVNAKQYHRILKRRVARARLAEVQRLSTQRKPYLHQSRHNHAVRRPRGPGGRFLTAEEIAARKLQGHMDQSPPEHEQEADEQPTEEGDGLNMRNATTGSRSSDSPTQDLDSTTTPKEDVTHGHAMSPGNQKQTQAQSTPSFGYGTVHAAPSSSSEIPAGGAAPLEFNNQAFPTILGTGSYAYDSNVHQNE